MINLTFLDFRISKDPRGNSLGRGTEIILHLRKDALSFLDGDKLLQIVKKHSEFINFPIYLWSEVEVEDEEPQAAEPESDVSDVEDAADKKDATESSVKTVFQWEKINENKPIWTKSPADVKTEEYHNFFKTHFKQSEAPLAHSHFKLEGGNRFTAMIFIPATAPARFLQPDAPITQPLQLFVRRVFITDDLYELLPKWLTFVKVLIDSDDLPLNVNRETLQNHASLKIIRNRIITKTLDLLQDLSEKQPEVYEKVFNTYSGAFRYGIIDAKEKHADKLKALLRFESSLKPGVSFDEYIKNMKKDQPQIYFATGNNFEEIKALPLAEKVIKRGYEVLLISNELEEYVVEREIKKYGDFPLQNVAKEGLLFGDEGIYLI